MYTQLGLYIDGKWNHGNGAGGEDVINPATGKSLAHLPHATASDLDAALAAAAGGFKLWKGKSAYDRGHSAAEGRRPDARARRHHRQRHDPGAGQGRSPRPRSRS